LSAGQAANSWNPDTGRWFVTLSDLRDCVVKVNADGFNILEREHQLSPDAGKTTQAARVYRLPQSPQSGGSLMCPGQAQRCFNGVTTGDQGRPTALERLISLETSADPNVFSRVAVGAVLDIEENDAANESTDAEEDRDAPVILVVGINYGQQSTAPGRGWDYTQNPPGLNENTGMRPRVAAVIRLLIEQGNEVQPLGQPYHLVAANFFPWITTEPWNECTRSVLTEELLLRYFGWPNALDFVGAIIQELQDRAADLHPDKGLTHIIFHGAQNATMRGGLALTGQLTRDHLSPARKLPLYRCYREDPSVPPLSDFSHADRRQRPGPDVIFSDNLAPSQVGTHIHNAVWLWQEDRRGSASSVMDMDE
jgi:hypothetical protein